MVEGVNIKFNDNSGNRYRLNTGWNESIILNPERDNELKEIIDNIQSSSIIKINNILNIYFVGRILLLTNEKRKIP